jgi:hypothetical protein
MKWDLSASLNDSHHWTLNEDEIRIALKYNKEAHSIRLHSDDKRLFFLEKSGMLQRRMVLKTEYSVEVGEAHFEKNRHAGSLILNETKHVFKVIGENLQLFNHQKQLVFEIGIKDIEDLELFEFAALLFGTGIITSKFGLRLQATPLVHE